MSRPTAMQVMAMIMNAARTQIAASEDAQKIIAAGLEAQLGELIYGIASNVAQPITWEFERAAEES